jgi:hypothetical protein
MQSAGQLQERVAVMPPAHQRRHAARLLGLAREEGQRAVATILIF